MGRLLQMTPASRVTIKHEPESSAAVVGWKFMERDKASGAHPQEFQQIADALDLASVAPASPVPDFSLVQLKRLVLQ